MSARRLRRTYKRIVVIAAAALAASLTHASMHAQPACANGVRVEGVVTDPAGALVAGAQVRAADAQVTTTDAAGRFVFLCTSPGSNSVTVQAEGFTPGTVSLGKQRGSTVRLNIQLAMAQVETDVQVSAEGTAMDSDNGAAASELGAPDVQRMPDDPDDFLRQLQVLASAAGGDPSAATITVDGFQNGSALPPKSSIAAIRVNPDLFSSEY